MGGEHTFEAVDRSAGALEAILSGLDMATLTGDGATRLVRRLITTERVIAAARAAAAKRAADANQWRQAGEASAAAWLAKLAGTTTGQAAASLTAAERLAALPATDTAARTGAISELQAREIASAATADPAAEADLLRRAQIDDAQALKRRCAEVRAAAERDEGAARERIRRARRFRGWTDAEGAFCFTGRGLPEHGAALLAAMKPHQDQAFHTARRRGKREATEAYAYDALMALARHRCDQATSHISADDTAPHTGDERPGEERPDDERPGDERPGDERPGDEGPGDERPGDGCPGDGCPGDEGPGSGASETMNGSSPLPDVASGDTHDERIRGGNALPRHAGNCDPHTEVRPAGASLGAHQDHDRAAPLLVGTLFTDGAHSDRSHGHAGSERVSATAGQDHDRRHAPQPDRTSSRLDGALSTDHTEVTSPPMTTVTRDHDQPPPPRSHPAHRSAPSSSDPPVPAGGRPARDRAGPPAKLIVRIDHTALVRGHTIPGEVCDIAGIGPVPVTAAREIARDAFLTAVVTHGINITHVVHLGRAATAHQRTALQARGMTCAVPGCGTTTGLEIDHVDGWAITRRTHLDHLDWLCHHHHQQKTHHSYRLAGPPGHRTWHPPDDHTDTG